MFVSQIGNINNAAFGAMQNQNGMTSLARGVGNAKPAQMNAIQQKEKGLQTNTLQNLFMYSALSAMEDSQRRQEKENIKRTFSTFA